MELKRRRQQSEDPVVEAVVASGEESTSRRCVVHHVPDELLRTILLRLDSPLWLLRAACVCKQWRRVITGDDEGRSFLRLASSLHPPVVAGHYQKNISGGGRRFVPSSPSSTPIDGSRFSLDFIPQDDLVTSGATPIKNWEVADCHNGLVLLRKRHGSPMSDLVVCDPLTRQYRRIHYPPAPGDDARFCFYYSANTFLIDGEGDGNSTSISISNFRVLYRSDDIDGSELYMFSFSMADGGDGGIGHWRFVRRAELNDCYRAGFGHVAGRLDGSLYLGVRPGVVTVLDMANLEFCKVDLPPSHVQQRSFLPRHIRAFSTFAVVHGPNTTALAAPSPPAVFIVHVHGDSLEIFRRRVHGGEWVLEHSIPRLSSATRGLPGCPDPKRFSWQLAEVVAAGTGSAILSAWIKEASFDGGASMAYWLFSFNVETMELQAVTNQADYCGKTMASAYTLPWPRFLRAGPC